MLEIKEKEEKLVSTSELAKMLNTTNNVILSVARKNGIEKIVKNGIPTYWNEKEVDIIIKNIDYNNSQAKQALTEVKGSIKTDLMIKEEANQSLENLKQLDIQDQIQASLLLQQNIIQQLRTHNLKLEAKIEEDKPLVEFANTVSQTYNYISIGDFAKITYKDLKLGSGNMFKFLKTHKILMENNIPYQQYIDAGYFKIKENTFNTAFGVKTYTRTFITGKGQIYLAKKIKNLQQLLNK